ncbi:hypothetical protein Mapa_008119 [Marchantia paleacea]|nr:hypothetical protein Mapa_008119 [Marchantia paleacea]
MLHSAAICWSPWTNSRNFVFTTRFANLGICTILRPRRLGLTRMTWMFERMFPAPSSRIRERLVCLRHLSVPNLRLTAYREHKPR